LRRLFSDIDGLAQHLGWCYRWERLAYAMDGVELYQKVRRTVMLNAKQTPQYSDIRFAGHEGGDFLFVRKN